MDAFTAGSTWSANRNALLTLPRRQVVLLAADWAGDVLPVWEAACPDDDRPRRAVEAARSGDGSAAASAYAASAYASAYAASAYAAAWAAANVAANAAWSAAWAAANVAANVAAAAAAAAAADAAAWAAAKVAGWGAVHARWLAAWHGGRAFSAAWRTPLGRQLAADPEAYPVLLDHLADLGADVDGLRGLPWGLSSWAVYHLTEGK